MFSQDRDSLFYFIPLAFALCQFFGYLGSVYVHKPQI